MLTEKNPTYRPEEEEVGEVQETEEAPPSPPARPRSCLCSALDQFGEVAGALCRPNVRPQWATASREDRQEEEVAETFVG